MESRERLIKKLKFKISNKKMEKQNRAMHGSREPLRENKRKAANGEDSGVDPRRLASRLDRGSALAQLKTLPGSDARWLGPDPCAVPAKHVCSLLPEGGEILGASGTMIALDRSPLIVGRNARSGADILLDDSGKTKLISQLHAVFRFVATPECKHGGSWEVFDLGSLNGTVVNGKKVNVFDMLIASFAPSPFSLVFRTFFFSVDTPRKFTRSTRVRETMDIWKDSQ